MAKILCKGGRVFDGEKFFFADVLTEGNKISKIEENISSSAEFVYDCTGKTVCPGLVDIHTHFEGISSLQFGINAEAACIPFGVTAALDASGCRGDKALLDSFLVKNKVFLCSEISDNKASFENALQMWERYGERVFGIKLYFDTAFGQVRDITPLVQTVAFARENGLKVMLHSSNPPVSMQELLSALGEGDILTHAYHGGKNNVSDDGFECIKKAKSRGVVIDAGMAGFVHTDFAVFRDAIAAGAAPDVISTDITRSSAYKRGGRYGLTMCMSIARDLGMSEEAVFRAVSSDAARAVNMQNEWGSLAVGRCADIAVIDYCDEGYDMTNRFGNRVKSDKGYRCSLTVADGEVVYRD